MSGNDEDDEFYESVGLAHLRAKKITADKKRKEDDAKSQNYGDDYDLDQE